MKCISVNYCVPRRTSNAGADISGLRGKYDLQSVPFSKVRYSVTQAYFDYIVRFSDFTKMRFLRRKMRQSEAFTHI